MISVCVLSVNVQVYMISDCALSDKVSYFA